MSIRSRPEGRRAAGVVMLVLVAFITPAVAGMGGRALAESKSPAAAERRQSARKLFEQAEHHFRMGRYRAALRDYDRAYRLSALPGFLLNMAHCQTRLHNVREANKLYRAYLQTTDADAPHRAAVEEALASSAAPQPKVEEPAAAAPPLVAIAPTPVAVTRPELESDGPRAASAARAPALEAERDSPEAWTLKQSAGGPDAGKDRTVPRNTSTARAWVWPLAAAAVVAAGVGMFFALRAPDTAVQEGSLGTLSR